MSRWQASLFKRTARARRVGSRPPEGSADPSGPMSIRMRWWRSSAKDPTAPGTTSNTTRPIETEADGQLASTSIVVRSGCEGQGRSLVGRHCASGRRFAGPALGRRCPAAGLGRPSGKRFRRCDSRGPVRPAPGRQGIGAIAGLSGHVGAIGHPRDRIALARSVCRPQCGGHPRGSRRRRHCHGARSRRAGDGRGVQHGSAAVTLTYRDAAGRVRERLLYRSDEPTL